MKALSVMGIPLKLKAVDPAKIGAAMAGKKKAEFKLEGDHDVVKVTVEAGNSVNTLGIFSLKGERDAEKKKVVMKSLNESGLITKKEYEEFLESTKQGEDPKVLANKTKALEKTIDDAKKLQAVYAKLTYDLAAKSPAILKEVEAEIQKRTPENILFLKAVAGNMAQEKIIANFLTEGVKYEINILSNLRKDIAAGTAKMDEAVREVKSMVNFNEIAAIKKKNGEELAKVISTAQKELDGLKKQS